MMYLMNKINWSDWHEKYAEGEPSLTARLQHVQSVLRSYLQKHRGEEIKLIDICAGDGRDIIGVLANEPDPTRVSGLLVEINMSLAAAARKGAAEAGARNITVIEGDAADLSIYQPFGKADLLLLCGVFGNISEADMLRTVEYLPMLCKPGARITWTLNRKYADKLDTLRAAWRAHSFTETEYWESERSIYAVGSNVYSGEHVDLDSKISLFSFIK